MLDLRSVLVRFTPFWSDDFARRRSKLAKIACRDPDLISRKGREVREGAGGDSMAETWWQKHGNEASGGYQDLPGATTGYRPPTGRLPYSQR